MAPPCIVIIGAGPAGLAAAERLGAAGLAVDIHDRMPSPARKFLMAGRGGLNITHSEPFERFLARYGAAAENLAPALRAFPPEALRAWAAELGAPTFVGSSGRVFPESFKASPLLRAWLSRLRGQSARFHLRHHWQGWDENGAVLFSTPEGPRAARADAVVLALGGGSWPRLGSDGGWVEVLARRGVAVAALRPANMGIHVHWPEALRARFAGAPLKRIAARCGEAQARGEAIITARGLEGGVIYALSRQLRAAIDAGSPLLVLDLRPDLTHATLAGRLAAAPRKLSFANLLRRAAGLSPAAIAVLRAAMGEARPPDPAALADLVKAVPLTMTGTAGLERAISSAGGIAWGALTNGYEIAAMPGVFACGEMLNWEAPTGGYLLQACLSTGRAAAEGVLARLGAAQPEKPPPSR